MPRAESPAGQARLGASSSVLSGASSPEPALPSCPGKGQGQGQLSHVGKAPLCGGRSTRPQEAWSLVDPDMALSSSTGQDITMVSGGRAGLSHIRLLLTASLSPVLYSHKFLTFSVSPISPTTYLLIAMAPTAASLWPVAVFNPTHATQPRHLLLLLKFIFYFLFHRQHGSQKH